MTTNLLDGLALDLGDFAGGDLTELFVRRDRTQLIAGEETISLAKIGDVEVEITHRLNSARLARATLLLNNRTGRDPYWSFTTNCKPMNLDVWINDGTEKIHLKEFLRRIVNASSRSEVTPEQFDALLRARNYLQDSMVMITQHNGVLKSVVDDFMDFMEEAGAADVTETTPNARTNDLLRVIDFENRPGLEIISMELGSVDAERYVGFTDLVNAQVKNISRMLENQAARIAATRALNAAEPNSPEANDAKAKVTKYQRAATTWLNNWGGVNPMRGRPEGAAPDAEVELVPTGDYAVCSVPCGDFRLKGPNGDPYELSVWAPRDKIQAEMRAAQGTVAERLVAGALSDSADDDEEPV